MLESGTSNGNGAGGARTESGSESGLLILVGDEDHQINNDDAVKRGWDWRLGLSAQATGDDVLRILRLGLATDLSRGWLEGEV